ncbi:outer mitochondrial transmembrane helix translocase [Drosophila biarmipes]|uniref:outer mitochondrial transmembrane helix translocase n=1 Tax=Drosophila biarmipes TaxID=125945 RepID=UPI0007E5C6B4|nr:outer mitochondrial transmembrane helix translocase [Drosophila biarmipes]
MGIFDLTFLSDIGLPLQIGVWKMDSPDCGSRGQILAMVVRVCAVTAITYYSAKWMLAALDPNNKMRKKAKQVAEQQLRKLNSSAAQKFRTRDFNEHEVVIASHLVTPEDIDVTWADIAGLDAVIQEIRETVVLPVRHRELFRRSQLWRAPKGVLLHGPPGCGKTLIAKAIAKDAGMRFINLDVAVLTDKWYGESQKLATAVFTLAQKIQPCIIFIDEIESFLRMRGSGDHEATAMMKTQFMLQWDGLMSSANVCVLVLGATNRPQDLDKAILRRMPAQFHIGVPHDRQRQDILRLILQSEQLNPSVNLKELARLTPGFSGSDLRELCRHASMYRMRLFMRENLNMDGAAGEGEFQGDFQSKDQSLQDLQLEIHMDDLLKSLTVMKVSKFQAHNAFVEKDLDLD